MTPRKVALARAFPILIGMVVFGAFIVFLALRTVRGIEQSEEVAARFERLAGACGNGASNLPQLTPMAESGGPGAGGERVRGVAFRLVAGEWVYDATALPVDWRPASPEEVQVVLCLGPSEPLVTTACGAGEEGVAPTRVYGEALAVRLVDAASGETLAQDVLRSAPQVDCRDEQGVVVRVDAERIGEWVSGGIGE